ncbi:hypothetical protein [uncultured Gimesia sp.]|uniref:hypothetical protein n=1 Tax=uncultured Gimesia sp. TaxID=1678688 RepID=UPI002602950C|nr:hypothetical protein [uncultured Gimesia sp.]
MLMFVLKRCRSAWILSGLLSLILISPLNAQKPKTPAREQIGEVFGKPVYRDEIPTGTNQELHDKLQWLFWNPVFDRYYLKHKSKFDLTKKEVASATAYFTKVDDYIKGEALLFRAKLKSIDDQLKQPGITVDVKRRFEKKKRKIQLEYKQDSMMSCQLEVIEIENFERHLYKNYGGGRIRYQMMGSTAFDATHKWLEDQEKKGHFKITDPKSRTAFYLHWTDKVDIGIIENDKEDIQQWLLRPSWAPKPVPEK